VDVLHASGSRPQVRGRSDDSAAEHGRELLDSTADLASDADLAVETHLVDERPARALTDFAAEHDADLLVLGRKGRSGLGPRLLGSVTEQVLRRTDRPVLTVPGGTGITDVNDGSDVTTAADQSAVLDRPIDADAVFEHVLVTTDGSEMAEWAAPHADYVAEQCDAALSILSVVDVQAAAGVFDAGGVSKGFVERLEQQSEDAVNRLGESIERDHDSAIVRGTPHAAIQEYVTENDVDLVVMASRGQSGLAGQRLGSVTGRVLRVADVPVLVVTSAP
jgi:nucleotide-binding universal stress UspA family protein